MGQNYEKLLIQFADAINELQKYGGLPSLKEANEIWKDIWYIEVHNSTALEGNTLVLSQVEKLLKTNKISGRKDIKDFMEVRGYADASKWVYEHALKPTDYFQQDALLTLKELRIIHELSMTPVWNVSPHKDATEFETPGNFRQHDIVKFDRGMKPVSFVDIHSHISTWIEDVNQILKELKEKKITLKDIPLRLAKIHNQFERIHPFLDGNGRIGRLVINLILVKLSLPPMIIIKKRRNQYIDSLDLADRKNYSVLAEVIVRGILDNIYRFIIPHNSNNESIVPLLSLASKTISYEALKKAAIRGRIKATYQNSKWYSTKSNIKEYLDSRKK